MPEHPPRPTHRPATWAALLAAWTDFARASATLPKTPETDAFRRAVPPIIGLQAVTFALRELDSLPPSQREAGLDTASVLVRQYTAAIHEVWRAQELHPEVQSLIADARKELADATNTGVEWVVRTDRLVAEHPAELVAALLASGFKGDLFIPAPGVPLFATCPCAFVRNAGGGESPSPVLEAVEDFLGQESIKRSPPRRQRQAYRQFDFGKGGAVRDLVLPFDSALAAGQPLLVPAVIAGEAQPVPLPIRGAGNQEDLPVEFE